MEHLHHELKKEFQLERMILFSDAVFAIAITLLVIDLKVPQIHENISDKALLGELAQLLPKLVWFIFTFWLIGLYWTIHHRMFGYVINYNRKLIWLNLFFLLTIVLMPFSTGFYGEYSGGSLVEKQLKVPMTVYVGNICATGIANYLLWSYIGNPRNKLAEHLPGGGFVQLAKARSLVVPLASLLMLPVAWFINVFFAVFMPALIPVYMGLCKRYFNRKYGTTKNRQHQK